YASSRGRAMGSRRQRSRRCDGGIMPMTIDPARRSTSQTWHLMPTEVIPLAARNVVLSQHQHELVDSMVTSGRYQNASEVLRAGLRLLEHQEAEEAARLAALRAAADAGWSDAASGRSREITDGDLDQVIAELGHRAAQRTIAD